MKRCTGIEFLNQCEYSVLCENGFGCKYEKECDFQRPKITAHNSDYAKCTIPDCTIPDTDNQKCHAYNDGKCMNGFVCKQHFA